MSLNKEKIKNIREMFNIPNSAKFCGFVIHIPENDEFIATIEDNNFVKIIGYSATPDFAIKYRRYDKAITASKRCDKYKTIIGYLFDLGERYFVALEA
jgi:hypothetical protein